MYVYQLRSGYGWALPRGGESEARSSSARSRSFVFKRGELHHRYRLPILEYNYQDPRQRAHLIPVQSIRIFSPSAMTNPHVFITGGSRGIGLAIAHLFARNSYRCTLLSRSEPPLKAAVSDLNTQYPLSTSQHSYITGSVSSSAFWSNDGIGKSLSSTNDGADNKIHVLVNCAGMTQSELFVKTDPGKIQEIVDTNLTGLMLGTRFLLRNRYFGSVRDGNRSIVNVASLLGTHGGHGAVAYAASKAGILGFTRALAAELGRQKIRVNAVVPGYVETDMIKGMFILSSALCNRVVVTKVPLR